MKEQTELLNALNEYSGWFQNWVKDSRCNQEEFDSYVEVLNSLEPHEQFRFIHSDYSVLAFMNNPNYIVVLEAIKELYGDRGNDLLSLMKTQSVDFCLEALEINEDFYRGVKIVPNPDFKTTLSNLKKKQKLMSIL